MNFKVLSARVLEPASMVLMVAGIVSLCQPWSKLLHTYGVTIILVGLVGFMIFSHIRPDAAENPVEE